MDSIYHIETDLKCRVLHYGTEICVATPGEDVAINLRKGKHKLTFISVENLSDQYSILHEVPENDIEDFISVELAVIRAERLLNEERQRQAKLEEERKKKEAELRRQQNEDSWARMRAEKRKKEAEEAEKRKREAEAQGHSQDGLVHYTPIGEKYKETQRTKELRETVRLSIAKMMSKYPHRTFNEETERQLESLRCMGWSEEDIEYFQKTGELPKRFR